MEVFVVLKYYYNYEDSTTTVIGVRESEAEANALIVKNRQADNHPLVSAEDWFDGWKAYHERVDRLKKEEKNTPKKGGWLLKFHREQLSKMQKDSYDKLMEVSAGISFIEFSNKGYTLKYRNLLETLMSAPTAGLTEEQRSELVNFYPGRNPDCISYDIKKFDTKA